MVWLRLARAAAIPTALSNILVGFLIMTGGWTPSFHLALLLICSGCLYAAGMVFNDVFDYRKDCQDRPERPLPSGAISLKSAIVFGSLLIAIGIISAVAVSILANTLRPILIAILLVVSIILYDGPLKRTVFGPLLMGLCRFLNVLLGASLTVVPDGMLGFSFMVWWVAMSIGILITGTTLFARHESRQNAAWELIPGGTIIVLGIFTLVATCFFRDFPLADRPRRTFPILMLLIAVPILLKVFPAIVQGRPALIQKTVGSIIRSLIFIDAAVVWLAADDQVYYPVVVLLLLIPSFLLGKLSKIS